MTSFQPRSVWRSTMPGHGRRASRLRRSVRSARILNWRCAARKANRMNACAAKMSDSSTSASRRRTSVEWTRVYGHTSPRRLSARKRCSAASLSSWVTLVQSERLWSGGCARILRRNARDSTRHSAEVRAQMQVEARPRVFRASPRESAESVGSIILTCTWELQDPGVRALLRMTVRCCSE